VRTTVFVPFRYSDRPHRRKHGPRGYEDYSSFKPWLRDEFAFRCAYCLEREMWYPDRASSFCVDHIEPRSRKPSLICKYQNLVYSCNRCNSAKQDQRILDPMSVAFASHLNVRQDGSIEGLSTEGRQLIDILGLNETPAIDNRRRYLLLIGLKAEFPDDPTVNRLFIQSFAFPMDLPDLTRLRPPGGNSRTGSEQRGFHELRSLEKLGEVY
jgi:hypothetical protein